MSSRAAIGRVVKDGCFFGGWIFVLSFFSKMTYGADNLRIILKSGEVVQGELSEVYNHYGENYFDFSTPNSDLPLRYHKKSFLNNLSAFYVTGENKYLLEFVSGKRQVAFFKPQNSIFQVVQNRKLTDVWVHKVQKAEFGYFEPIDSEKPGKRFFIKTASSNLFAKPAGTVVGQMKQGTRLRKLVTQGDWTMIEVEGWVKSSDIR